MSQAIRLAEVLVEQRLTLATAESCTGGGLSHLLTSIPGSSAFFIGGIIAYQNRVKTAFLGVPLDILAEYGAVSAPTASAMAEGCRDKFDTDIAVSITGIAGPGGGSHPVAGPSSTALARRRSGPTERQVAGSHSACALASGHTSKYYGRRL